MFNNFSLYWRSYCSFWQYLHNFFSLILLLVPRDVHFSYRFYWLTLNLQPSNLETTEHDAVILLKYILYSITFLTLNENSHFQNSKSIFFLYPKDSLLIKKKTSASDVDNRAVPADWRGESSTWSACTAQDIHPYWQT